MEKERAIVFIDGSNWFHAAKRIQVTTSKLDYRAVADKLAQGYREIVEIRYYVGQVTGGLQRSRDQRKFLTTIRAQNVQIVLGDIREKKTKPSKNPVQKKLSAILADKSLQITPATAFTHLKTIAKQTTTTYTEKRVDVNIAVDMVVKAMKDEFDVVY